MSKESVTISFWLPTQVGLLVLEYGLKLGMPWWVVWFPSLLIVGILGIVAAANGVMVIAAFAAVLYDEVKTMWLKKKYKKVHEDWIKEMEIKGR